MAQALRAEFQVVTPLFLGGAEQTRADLRAPALKGLLRFWYRAADPDFMDREPALFGAAGGRHGQSAILLHVEGKPPTTRPVFADFQPRRFSQRGARQPLNGLIYLGYPFQMRGNDERQSIPAGHTFTLRCFLPRAGDGASEHARDTRRALASALWLMGHFGAAGSRARRGFGGLALTGWAPASDAPGGGGPWPELEALPLAATAATVAEAEQALARGLEMIRDWFPADGWDRADHPRQHPHLGPKFRFRLQRQGQTDWAPALAGMGLEMQRFRSDMAPNDPGNTMRDTPARASFGLPLMFRYPGTSITIVPKGKGRAEPLTRHGSLLLLKLLPVGGRLYPLYVRMDGAVAAENPTAMAELRRNKQRNPERIAELQPARRDADSRTAMDAFFDSLGTAGRAGR